ncbi:MAG: hypothetical protein M3R21_04425, partial [Candidatus Dormibacteraeota bacterium]|nr:hypothetical protein [Candidatus Dormibacteraeota bacterium]
MSNGKATLGILFVHGIGDQPQGDTLVSFGEPLYQWVRDWLEGAQEAGCLTKATVEIVDAQVRPSSSEEEAPASARVVLTTIDTNGHPETAEWRLAESWWAATLLPPS